MAMTSQFPQQEFPFTNFTTGSFPSSSAASEAVPSSFSTFNATDLNRQQRTNGHTIKRNLAASGIGYDDGEPKAKRKVDRMNAHFKNFHISPEKNPNHEVWQSHQRDETLQEIEDRLSDSSEEEMLEDDEEESGVSADDTAKEVRLSQMLKEYIKNVREKPVVMPSISDKALVPYVPRNPLDDPTMRGRIREISEEEASMISNYSTGRATPYVEDLVEEEKDKGLTSSNSDSTSLSFVELPDDSEFDMDVDFE